VGTGKGIAAESVYELEHHPEMAAYVGDARFNDRLSDYSRDEQAPSGRPALVNVNL
jgi:hypothetical protein